MGKLRRTAVSASAAVIVCVVCAVGLCGCCVPCECLGVFVCDVDAVGVVDVWDVVYAVSVSGVAPAWDVFT